MPDFSAETNTASGLPEFRSVRLEAPNASRGLVINPNVAFFLRHHPAAWEVDQVGLKGPSFLPQVTRFWLLPGANGVRTISEHESPVEAYRTAMQEAMNKGWVFLDPAEPVQAAHRPKGTPESGYLVAASCRQPGTNAPGTYHDEVWNRPMHSVPGERAQFQFDRASYNRWRAHLVASSLVAPPTERVIESLRRRYQAHVERIEVLSLPDEVRKRRVKDAKEIADMFAKAVIPTMAPALTVPVED
jgi:hypothetical protein